MYETKLNVDKLVYLSRHFFVNKESKFDQTHPAGDLAMVKNGLLQFLLENLRFEYNSTTILSYESVQNTAM